MFFFRYGSQDSQQNTKWWLILIVVLLEKQQRFSKFWGVKLPKFYKLRRLGAKNLVKTSSSLGGIPWGIRQSSSAIVLNFGILKHSHVIFSTLPKIFSIFLQTPIRLFLIFLKSHSLVYSLIHPFIPHLFNKYLFST